VLRNAVLHYITLQLQLKEYMHNYDLQLVQQLAPRNWHSLIPSITTNKKVIMITTGLIIYMEDMAEDIVEEDIMEEDIKEDLIRRSAMFVIGQVVDQLSTLLRNTKRHIRSSANILCIP
jgi:predicted Holliday junction resolvase-like endonuclease